MAKARTESFIDPVTGKYDTKFASVKELRDDQTRRMGALAEKVGSGEPAVAAPQTHTPVSAGKIGFGSEGPEVLQLKKDLKTAGLYEGALKDKPDNCRQKSW